MRDETLFQANLRSLRKRYPAYADLVSALPDPKSYSFEAMGSAVLCRHIAGAWVHGPEDPWVAARSDARQLAELQPQLYIVLRPGLGYQAVALVAELAAREAGSLVVVVEDQLDLWKAGLGFVDWAAVLHSPSAVLLLGNPYEVVESFLREHASLSLLPTTLVAAPEVAHDPECQRLAERLQQLSYDCRDAVELALGRAGSELRQRRARSGPPRVVLAGCDFGYLSAPIAAGFRNCGCDVLVETGDGQVPRDVRGADWLSAIANLQPDLIVWMNRPELSSTAHEAVRALGIANVLWSVDSTRRMGLRPSDLEKVDLLVTFDAAELAAGVAPGCASCAQLSLAAGVPPFPGSGAGDDPWPARLGPTVSFVGALGEARIRGLREILRRRDPEELELLERLALDPGDASNAYERIRDRRLRGASSMYVDEVRTKRWRLEVLSHLASSSLTIYGGAEWSTDAGALGACHAGRSAHYGFDLAAVYYHAKINLNVFHVQCVDATNSRVYDVLAAGGFLLSEHRPCLDREFELGRHLVTFTSPDEAREKVDYFLAHPDEREAIAREGQRHVLAHHTFEHRCRRLLELARPYIGQTGSLKVALDAEPRR